MSAGGLKLVLEYRAPHSFKRIKNIQEISQKCDSYISQELSLYGILSTYSKIHFKAPFMSYILSFRLDCYSII